VEEMPENTSTRIGWAQQQGINFNTL